MAEKSEVEKLIEVEVLATGSKGNCYLLKSGETKILLDCGIAYKKTMQLLNFELPDAVLVTHEHTDHAKAAADFIKHGVDVYMTHGTAMALGLETSHRLHLIDTAFYIGNFWAFKVKHDAAEPINFTIDDGGEEILQYVTDTSEIEFFASDIDKFLIETNFSEKDLLESSLDGKQKVRILENHLSVEKVEKFFTKNKFPRLKEVYLIHISERHGDGAQFQKIIQTVVGDNVKVIVAKNKKLEE